MLSYPSLFRLLPFASAFLAAILIPLLVAPVAAADAALPEMVVSATAEPAELSTLPASVQVIDAQALARSGAATLDRVLEKYMPGMGTSQPGAFSAVGMRGFRSGQSVGTTLGDRVLVLIDGHRSGTGNPGVIPMANVERVEIVRGPSSVLYGGSAMGGVVNVITRRGSGAGTGFAEVRGGSAGKGGTEAGVAGGLADDRWGYSFGVQGLTGKDYKDGNGQRYDNSAYNSVAAGGTVTYRPEPGRSLSLVAAHQSVFNTGSPGYYPFGLTPDDKVRNAYNYAAFEYDAKLEDGHTVRASLFADRNRYDFEDRTYSGDNSTYRADTLGGKLVYALPLFECGRLALGTDYTRITESNYGTAVYQPDAVYDVFGLFAEHRATFERVNTVLGVRYDMYRNRTRSAGDLDVRSGTTTYSHLTWNAGATWWALDWLGLRASVGSAFVPPTAKNMAGQFATSGPWGMRYKGNPNLNPERSISGELGVEVEHGAFRAGAAWFYTRYTDRITTRYLEDAVTFVNAGEQRISGLDLSARWDGTFDVGREQPLEVVPYLNAEFYTMRKESGALRPLNIPAYSAVAGVGIGSGKGAGRLWLDVNARLTGRQWQNDPVTFTPSSMPSFAVWNARITYSPLDSLDVYLDVSNMLDKQYAWTWGYPMPGREVFLGLRYSF